MDRYKELYQEFERTYDLTTLNGANDRTNLETIIRNTVTLEALSRQIDMVSAKLETESDPDQVAQIATTIKKLSDTQKDFIDRNLALERQLGIDRKSRKKDTETTTAEYILFLKQAAREYLEKRLVKVYCPQCKILLLRVSAAYDHVEYHAGVQCPQCGKVASISRKERDVFFDLHPRDRDWRRKYMLEIKLPKVKKEQVLEYTAGDDFVIDDEEIEYE